MAKQGKALVFTQFREITAPLASFLGVVFGRPGLVLHGETEVKKRKELVRRFQAGSGLPVSKTGLAADRCSRPMACRNSSGWR